MQKINNEPTHKKYFLSYKGHENIFPNAPQNTFQLNLFQDELS